MTKQSNSKNVATLGSWFAAAGISVAVILFWAAVTLFGWAALGTVVAVLVWFIAACLAPTAGWTVLGLILPSAAAVGVAVLFSGIFRRS